MQGRPICAPERPHIFFNPIITWLLLKLDHIYIHFTQLQVRSFCNWKWSPLQLSNDAILRYNSFICVLKKKGNNVICIYADLLLRSTEIYHIFRTCIPMLLVRHSATG